MPQYLYVLMTKLIRVLDGRNCSLSNVFANLQKHFSYSDQLLSKGTVPASHRDEHK